MAQLRVRVTDDDRNLLHDLARKRGTTVSALIRDYVEYLCAGGWPVSYTDDEPTIEELMALAAAGGAFDWLADEPDLYTWEDGEPI